MNWQLILHSNQCHAGAVTEKMLHFLLVYDILDHFGILNHYNNWLHDLTSFYLLILGKLMLLIVSIIRFILQGSLPPVPWKIFIIMQIIYLFLNTRQSLFPEFHECHHSINLFVFKKTYNVTKVYHDNVTELISMN